MKLTEITFKKLYSQIIFKLKKTYDRANSSFSLASPYGHTLTILTELFQLNMLYVQNVRRQFDLNDPLNSDTKSIRSLAKIGQYNPSRGTCANGSINIQTKAGIDVNSEIGGGKIVFRNKQKIKNERNNLDYVLDLNQDRLTFTLSNQVPIQLNIIQGSWQEISFTGTGEINQSFVIPKSGQNEIDEYRVKVFVNGELWQRKKHKFDMLPNEKAYVLYTSFSGGCDIIFGNTDEGMVPELSSIITVEFLETSGKEGNIIDPLINEFKFIDLPTDFFGEDVDTEQFFDIGVSSSVTFGTDGESAQWLKQILPYASSNFVLANVDQYKFTIMRMGIFSIVDVFVEEKSNSDFIKSLYELAKQNTIMLGKASNDDNGSTLRQLISQNLKEINQIKKLNITAGGNNLIKCFLIPDIRIFYGNERDTNYFNISLDAFLLNQDEKNRILEFLSREGIQTILNEVQIVDPIVKKYAVNVTIRIFDDAIIDNINNEIINEVSEYFINLNRRDRIPPSDLTRIIDGIEGIDSVDVTYLSELNELYHKEYLIKAERFKGQNGRYPSDDEIIMSDGLKYNSSLTIGLDSILGDIIIEKTDLPIIRGGFSDRYNNVYNIKPGLGQYSAVNIIVLPGKTPRKKIL